MHRGLPKLPQTGQPKEPFRPLPKGYVKHYRELEDYSWVGDFLTAKKLEDALDDLCSEIRNLKRQPLMKADVLVGLKEPYQQYRKRRAAKLGKHLLESGGRGFEFLAPLRLDPLLTWEEVVEAVDGFSEETGLTAKSSEEQLSKLSKKEAALIGELEAVCPPKFCRVHNGKIKSDFRADFVAGWERVQHECDGPCNPQGFCLSLSPDFEQAAWKALGIGASVNPKALKSPGETY